MNSSTQCSARFRPAPLHVLVLTHAPPNTALLQTGQFELVEGVCSSDVAALTFTNPTRDASCQNKYNQYPTQQVVLEADHRGLVLSSVSGMRARP